MGILSKEIKRRFENNDDFFQQEIYLQKKSGDNGIQYVSKYS